MVEYAWLIPVFPLVAFLVIVRHQAVEGASGYVAVAGSLRPLRTGAAGLRESALGAHLESSSTGWCWRAGLGPRATAGAGTSHCEWGSWWTRWHVMLLVVTSVGFCDLLPQGYMHGRGLQPVLPSSLFCASMLGLRWPTTCSRCHPWVVGLCSFC